MRFIWLSFCCILAGVTHAQADSYRDRDDGFNPMNVMQGMPNPINMFDSSDRDEHPRRPPPPPRVAPRYPYPAPPAYGMPPTPRAPYYAAPNTQPALQSAPQRPQQPPTQANVAPSPESAVAAPAGSVPPFPLNRQSPTPLLQDTAQPAYSFRPMTAPEQAASEAPMATDQTRPGNPSAAASAQHRSFPTNGQTVVTPPYQEQETPMVNGQPAVFRPMDLGGDQPPAR
ncbi:MAG: hypothetical protein PVG22_03640 [Chromatiales bacterium]|jgi:hypothetical protein